MYVRRRTLKAGTLLLAFLLLCFSAAAQQLVLNVSAYNAVTPEGSLPEGVTVQYMQYQKTNYKGRLAAGDSAVLQISGLPEGDLSSLELLMHSNKSAGAGRLLLAVNNTPVWSIADAPFSSASWAGAYSTDYQPISNSFTSTRLGTIRLVLAASVNSLYISRFTISYREDPPAPHTVAFDTHDADKLPDLIEDAIGAGVQLPSFDAPREGWSFLGWLEQPLSAQPLAPICLSPGTIYYPRRNTVLHAVYVNRLEEDLWLQSASDIQSGDYVLVFPQQGVMAVSAWQNNALLMKECTPLQEGKAWRISRNGYVDEAAFHLSFTADSVLIRHVASGQYMGYRFSSGKPEGEAVASPWHWSHAAEPSVVFDAGTTDSGMCYQLRLALQGDQLVGRIRETLFDVSSLGVLLFPVPKELDPIRYTSYIFGDGLLAPSATTPTSRKVLRNGRLLLLSPDGTYCDLFGRPMR